jgi:hypothetical protein
MQFEITFPNGETDKETITYSPLNTPVLDLTNDNDSIAYHSTGTMGKITSTDYVTTTAQLYLNGDPIENSEEGPDIVSYT